MGLSCPCAPGSPRRGSRASHLCPPQLAVGEDGNEGLVWAASMVAVCITSRAAAAFGDTIPELDNDRGSCHGLGCRVGLSRCIQEPATLVHTPRGHVIPSRRLASQDWTGLS